MCGIFGFAGRNPALREILPHLAWAMEARGEDSWGAFNERGEVFRKLGLITEGWKERPDWANPGESEWVCFHTRNASQGEVTLENAHPFEHQHGERVVIGCHNGCLSGHQALNEKYGREFEVDSQHIFQHIVESLPTEELIGWGACVWSDQEAPTRERRLHMVRFNMEAFHVYRFKDGSLVWASTNAPLKAAKMYKAAEGMVEYRINNDMKYQFCQNREGWYLGVNGPMKFGPKTVLSVASVGGDTSFRTWVFERPGAGRGFTVYSSPTKGSSTSTAELPKKWGRKILSRAERIFSNEEVVCGACGAFEMKLRYGRGKVCPRCIEKVWSRIASGSIRILDATAYGGGDGK